MDASASKTSLRDQIQTDRNRRPVAEAPEAARELTRVLLAVPEVQRAATIALYVAVTGEPGTGPLIDILTAAGKRVILPVVAPDGLDWAPYGGADSLAPARFGLLEPVTPRLGKEAIGTADAVLVPAMAVDRSGMRLGKGGGYYDRALAFVPVGTFVCALLFDGEIVDAVPADPHDRRVTAAATPTGLVRFS